MTTQENAQLRDLLARKIQEYTDAIAYIKERCEIDDMAGEFLAESAHIRAARTIAKDMLNELRPTSTNYVEATLDNIKATQE